MTEDGVVAIIAPEIAIHQDLHMYGGGLGFLMGDAARSYKKLGIPAVFFLPYWRNGYYDQTIENRLMQVRYEARHYPEIFDRTGIRFSIPINGSRCWLEIWRLSEEHYNTSTVYFLDADIEGNDYLTRLNTRTLYAEGYNHERRIAVSQILGAGSLEILKCLGVRVQKYHLQESHAAFAAIELFLSFFEVERDVGAALNRTRSKVIFTTHTPVVAGNPVYDMNLVMRLCGYAARVERSIIEMIGQDPNRPHLFNMAAACMRLAGKTNAVSRNHAEIARKMWRGVEFEKPIIAITNGVSQEFWQYPEFRQARTFHQLEEAKRHYVKQGIEYIARHTEYRGKVHFSENIPTLVWARRFAEYKRPRLLFRNLEWISSLLRLNKLQIVMAGKPHPDDSRMIGAFDYLLNLSYELPNFVVLPGYELEMSKVLKGLARIWLNTPRSPDEASGTSGMSANMNGAIHMSTPAGWALEADSANCMLFGAEWPREIGVDAESETAYLLKNWQDAYDAQELQKVLDGALQLFVNNRDEWNRKALAAMREVERRFTSDRMISEVSAFLYED